MCTNLKEGAIINENRLNRPYGRKKRTCKTEAIDENSDPI